MKKSLPPLNSDTAAETFLEQDISDYLHEGNFHPTSFEFLPKDEKVNLRLSGLLLEALKQRAKKRSMPYQKLIRQILEREVLDDFRP